VFFPLCLPDNSPKTPKLLPEVFFQPKFFFL